MSYRIPGALFTCDSGGLNVVVSRRPRIPPSYEHILITMTSQNDLFEEDLGNAEPVDIHGHQQDAEDDDGNVVEGVVVGTRRPNDFDRKTKRTITWQEGELGVIINHLDDKLDVLFGHCKESEYRRTRVNAWKNLLNAINNWNVQNGTNVVRSVLSIRTKIRNLKQRSKYEILTVIVGICECY